MGQYLGLWEWLRGRSHLGVMESLVMESLGGLESLDRRSFDLESLEGSVDASAIRFSDRQSWKSWAHNRECVYNKQQIEL